MYQVLARKYRPRTFDEVIGQETIVHTLKNAVTSNRTAHAYIFSGTRGVGKTSLARILAKSINCEKGPTINPCGLCSACAEIQNGSSIDVIEIDGASNTGVNDIRELKENILYSPQSLKYKIYIIDEVHMLSNSAFNALLKTLEEPPAHVKFIFATTEIHKVPETILSRCQRFTFKRIPPDIIYAKLKTIAQEEDIKVSDENLMTLSSLSDGSLRDALSTFDMVISYFGKDIKEDVSPVLGITQKNSIRNIANALFKKDYESSIKIVNDIYISGSDIRQFIRQLAFFLRNILVLKLNYQGLITDMLKSEVSSLIPLAEQKTSEELLDMIDILLEADSRYQRISSPLLMMELVIFRLINIPSKKDIKALLEKINKLDALYRNPLSYKTVGIPIVNNERSEPQSITPLSAALNRPDIVAINSPIDKSLDNNPLGEPSSKIKEVLSEKNDEDNFFNHIDAIFYKKDKGPDDPENLPENLPESLIDRKDGLEDLVRNARHFQSQNNSRQISGVQSPEELFQINEQSEFQIGGTLEPINNKKTGDIIIDNIKEVFKGDIEYIKKIK
jgi:DNA polymerase-3 subunit gamma/tau